MRYSQEVKEFVAANVAGRTTKELVELTNAALGTTFTEDKMKCFKHNHKLKSGTPTGNPKGESKVFPETVQQFIRDQVKGKTNQELTDLINAKFGTQYLQSQIRAYKKNHKHPGGIDTKFKKGRVSHNAGRKGWCAPGCEKGWFKKGMDPLNIKPIGSERIDVYGYILVKIKDPNIWEFKHRLVWESAHGKIPDGGIVTFLDGDKQNVDINNLALVTNNENLELNRSRLRSNIAAHTETGILIAKIRVARGKKVRK